MWWVDGVLWNCFLFIIWCGYKLFIVSFFSFTHAFHFLLFLFLSRFVAGEGGSKESESLILDDRDAGEQSGCVHLF